MTFLNEHDIETVLYFTSDSDDDRQNLARAAAVVDNLARWTNANSDGWVYWPKPQRAAQRLIDHLHREFLGRYDARTGADISPAELAAGVRTIKAFLTRQGVTGQAQQRIVRIGSPTT